MTSLITALILGVTLFAATNLDDIFILVAFFADPRLRARQIVLGQFLGIGALILVSLVAALIALAIPPAYIGLLGLAPIAMGVRKLIELWRGQENEGEEEWEHQSAKGGGYGQTLAVAAVTMANGGDNIAVYTPTFAVRPGMETALMLIVFAFMTALWCASAQWLVYHPTIGAPIRRHGHRLLPFVLIGLGVLVLLEAGTFDFLQRLR